MSNTSIGKVAYKATWDATQLTKGLMSSRQMFSQQKKILESMRSPLERYVDGLTNLQNIVAKYPQVARHQFELEQQLEKQYLKEAQAVRTLTDEESRRLAMMSRHDKVRDRGQISSGAGGVAQKLSAREERDRQKELRRRLERERNERIAHQKRVGQLDRRRREEEERNVQVARRQLHQRLEDRRRYNIRMRDQIRQGLRHIQQEHKTWIDMMAREKAAAKSSLTGLGAAGMALRGGAIGAGGLLGTYMGARAIGGSVSDGVDLNRELERTEAAMFVFSRSQAMTEKMIEEIRQLSAVTGVSFSGYNQASRTLLQFGVAAEDLVPTLERLAIVTGGDGERMKNLALAYGQTTRATRLMGQEALQMVNAGWSPFEEISKRLGKSVPELRKMMEEGAISAEMVTQALKDSVEEGGRFHGMLESLEGTSARTADRSAAAWEEAKTNVGEALEPLTNVWHILSQDLAKQVSRTSQAFIEQKEVVEEINEEEQKRQERQQRMLKGQQRATEYYQEQARLEKEQRDHGLEAVHSLKEQVITRVVSEGDADEFSKIIGLLDHDKNRAIEDFFSHRDMSVLRSYLSEEVQFELDRVIALEKQADLIEKRNKLIEEGREFAKDLSDEMDAHDAGLTDEQAAMSRKLADLLVYQKLGQISADQFAFARDRAVKETTEKVPVNQVTPGIRAGSEEMYRFIAGIQDRNFQIEMKKQQEQTNLAKSQLMAQERANELLEEIADVSIGADG